MRKSHWPSLGWLAVPAQIKHGLGGGVTLDHHGFLGPVWWNVGKWGLSAKGWTHVLKGCTCIQGVWKLLPPLCPVKQYNLLTHGVTSYDVVKRVVSREPSSRPSCAAVIVQVVIKQV